MTEQSERTLLLPVEPRFPISIRVGDRGDMAFIDSVQKPRTRELGWMPTAQLEKYIDAGEVLIAEECSPHPGPLPEGEGAKPVGYCIARDRYFRREDVGIIYQLAVVPDRRRGLVGAMLVKEVFARAAYGCRLFCCWCAQDLAGSNRFWEAMGFVPLAFRAGSRGKRRVHIFWQRRVRAEEGLRNTGGMTVPPLTPFWFPSQTGGGAIREDRLVMPIPPGTHWSDAKPMVLPGMTREERKALPGAASERRVMRKRTKRQRTKIRAGGLHFPAEASSDGAGDAEMKAEAKEKSAPLRNDPRYVAAARELRDRYLEEVARRPELLEAARGGAEGKYEVGRLMGARFSAPMEMTVEPMRMLKAA